MISGSYRLRHGDRDSSDEAGEENGALHLGTSGVGNVVDGLQLAAPNFQRESVPRKLRDGGSHLLQGSGHPPHRPPPERCITGHTSREGR